MIQTAPSRQTLLMLSPLSAPNPDAGDLELPRKYLDGLRAFAGLWQGPLTVLMRRAPRRDDNLDYVSVQRSELGFKVDTFPADDQSLRAYIQFAKLVYVPLVPWYTQSMALCIALRIPIVLDADGTLKHRQDIIRVETPNPLVRLRRLWWVRRLEVKYRALIRAADGIQLNGDATFQEYAPLNRAPLLYFNTRVRRDMLVARAQLDERVQHLRSGAPLRLLYSGRWIGIKGVEDLPRVAQALRNRHLDFRLHLFGDGALKPHLERAIKDNALDNVHLHATLPFAELMRFACTQSDLFVCCHRQGDPSTTFMETLSAGVPLVGYDRQGLRGIVTHSNAGWLTPPDDVNALAARIAELDQDREALIAAAETAAAFTKDKSFQDLMQTRVAHLRMVADQ